MFIGATLLALGYQIFMWWVANNPESQPEESDPQSISPPTRGGWFRSKLKLYFNRLTLNRQLGARNDR